MKKNKCKRSEKFKAAARINQKIAVLATCKRIRVWNDNGFDQVYISCSEAARQLGGTFSGLARLARGETKRYKGFYAEYPDELTEGE